MKYKKDHYVHFALLSTALFSLYCTECKPETVSKSEISETLHELHAKESEVIERDEAKIATYRPHDIYSWNCIPGKLIPPQLIDKAQAAENAIPVKPVFNPTNPHQYLIFIATDGTSKDSNDIFTMSPSELVGRLTDTSSNQNDCQKQAREQSDNHTEPAEPSEAFPANPALLAWLVVKSGHPRVSVVYVHGVGADPEVSHDENLKNAATGDTLNDQIDEAYDDTGNEVAAIYANDAKAQIVFITTGFSRGAAAARALNTRILKEGIRNDDGYLIQPGKADIGASVLFDTVITQWVDLSPELRSVQARLHAKNSRNEIDASEYAIPDLVAQVLHITANNEYRLGFELKPATGNNVQEIAMPGAHSDIGGGYGFDGISAATLQMSISYLARAGIPMMELPNAFLPNTQHFAIHDSRKLPLMPFDDQIKLPRRLNTR